MLPPHRVLHDETALADCVRRLAREVRADAGEEPFVLVGVLTGSFVFVADLARELSRLGAHPQVEMAWMSAYDADGRPAAEIACVRDVAVDVAGRGVLLVDDIADSGRTLRALGARLQARGPAWLRTCVLLGKRGCAVDYAGFEAPEGWVFGYGMDTEGEGRALPWLAVRTHHLN
jgi:hypoxanthine phosphoribosyltransferase